jgi:hypothetical protein
MSRLEKGEFAEWVYDLSRNYYSGLNIPERPVNPPEPKEPNYPLAEQRLRESLKLMSHSPFWDDFVDIFFREVTDAEADAVVADILSAGRLSNLSPTSFVMSAVRERTIKKVAEQFYEQLVGEDHAKA